MFYAHVSSAFWWRAAELASAWTAALLTVARLVGNLADFSDFYDA